MSSTAASILQRAAASAANHPTRANAPMPQRTAAPAHATTHPAATHSEPSRTLQFGTEEAAVLRLDLSDLAIPKFSGLDVDGLKPTLFQRLFGKR